MIRAIQLTGTVLTPLFSSGVDTTKFELRAPEVRGGLRWWFRWAMGGSGLPAQEVWALEQETFGGTNRNTFRCELQLGNAATYYRQGDTLNQCPWRYLAGQGLGTPNGNNGYRFTREGLQPGCNLTLRVAPRRSEPWKRIQAALWLWTHFGGLGARTRRAFGSVEWAQPSVWDGPAFVTNCQTAQELKDGLRAGLRQALDVLWDGLTPGVPPAGCLPDFTCLGEAGLWRAMPAPGAAPPQTTWIAVLSGIGNTWEAALQGLGSRLRAFREQGGGHWAHGGHHGSTTWDWSHNVSPAAAPRQPLRNALLGLPEGFHSPAGDFAVAWGQEGRRASPLLLRLHKLQNSYAAVAVLSGAEFIAPGASLTIGGRVPGVELMTWLMRELPNYLRANSTFNELWP